MWNSEEQEASRVLLVKEVKHLRKGFKMSSVGSGYDLGCNIYSPDGRVFQIEYAAKAVENAGAMVALKCKDGVVVGVEKLVGSKLLKSGSVRLVLIWVIVDTRLTFTIF